MTSHKTTKDVYTAYAKKLLQEHSDWWGKYEQKLPNFRLYTEVNGKPKEVLSYPRFKAIISAWFKGSQDYIINGYSLMLGSSLGRIAGRNVERNFSKKVPNWGATMALWKKKGEKKGLVYFVDNDWVRIGWEKVSRIKNDRFYRFTPAEGNQKGEGFKQRFSQANEKDQLLKLKYKFFPFNKPVKQHD